MASIAAIAACGGGGGGSGTPSPVTTATAVAVTTPTPAATASPTPTSAAPTPVATNPGTLFVATNVSGGPVTAYAASSSGASAPLYTVSPSGIIPVALAEDTSGNLYVLSKSGSSVFVYSKGTLTRTITSSALVGPEVGVAADPSGNVYVLGYVNVTGIGPTYGVAVFAAGAGANATPTETYTQTAGAAVTGIAVDGAGSMYVAADPSTGYNEILVFAKGASGNATAARTITASQLGTTPALTSVAVDSNGNIYAGVTTSNSIVEFAPNANGASTPVRTLSGATTLLSNPTSIALDPANELLVQNVPSSGTPYITVYTAGTVNNTAPTRTITGAASGAITGGP